ncbi:MAG: hypothetical protein H7A37_08015 [Chlamydiales bacterium]|nr:hypothetical protein [Chlamydiia bacterium]MCP5508226.1 hypothetical protein [Chlamydiales bacterium]
MKIAYSCYELKRRDGAGKRTGALLRVDFEDGTRGYADLHPWTELGDKPLKEHLQLLVTHTNNLTPLLIKSIAFARVDAQARAVKVNLFDDITIPPSHRLVPNIMQWSASSLEQDFLQGFRYFKIKMGDAVDRECAKLKQILEETSGVEVRLRLDFNMKLLRGQFETFLEEIAPWSSKIDFIEDPFAYDPIFWQAMQEKYCVNLAADKPAIHALRDGFNAAKVLVVKPAVDQEREFITSQTSQAFVFTSYLDHPFGQMCAACVAAEMMRHQPQRMKTCGLLSHYVYETTPFSELLHGKGPFLQAPTGTGFGFDDLLEKQNWLALA